MTRRRAAGSTGLLLACAVARNGEIVWSEAFGFADRPLPFADTIRCHGAEIQKPGSRYTYSNLGFGAVGETVARVSGQRSRDFLAREVFAPLGLKRAIVPERAEEAVGAAKRYARDGSVLPFYVTDFPGGSAVFASVEDRAVRLVSRGSAHGRAAGHPHACVAHVDATEGNRRLRTGLERQFQLEYADSRLAQRRDARRGRDTVVVPAEKIAIAIVANQIGAPVNQLAGEILANLLPAAQPAAGSAASGGATPSTTVPAPPAQTIPPAGIEAGSCHARSRRCSQSMCNVQARLNSRSAPRVRGCSTERSRVGACTRSSPARQGSTKSQYQLDLHWVGNRLEGPVTRRTSLGPRANESVTIWAELESQR